MSIIDKLQQSSIQTENIEGCDDLPDVSSWLQSPTATCVQEGDIILLTPRKCKGRWPGLVKCINVRSRNVKYRQLKRPKRILRNNRTRREEDFTYSYDYLTVHLLNFPDALRIQQEIKPLSKVEFYSFDKQKTVVSEWQKSSHIEYISNLFKAFEEAETYLRKRSVQTLNPGTAVEQYMQVKRSRLDFNFEGIEHTDQDKHFRIGDISSNNLDTSETVVSEYLNSCVGSNEDADSTLERQSNPDLDATEEPKPCLSTEEFVCLTDRLKCCEELLRAIYLGRRYSLKHKTYFCNNRQDKNLLKLAYVTSFDGIPYTLDNAQKTDILDIVLEFANGFVNRDPRKETFSVPTYAYDVLLPECTTWLTVELESYPLIFTSNHFN
ncbi:hypothetical protein LOD99_2692 [Oopsacas minuta]|uniref:Uncharacterized protein n=1 Tax=Oopsacas minuta TaxID=111878 RepID=A0AAV7K0U7_9METZ|nr:hypothetical protein LOD99_2692 [Oopsacas minuta]